MLALVECGEGGIGERRATLRDGRDAEPVEEQEAATEREDDGQQVEGVGEGRIVGDNGTWKYVPFKKESEDRQEGDDCKI